MLEMLLNTCILSACFNVWTARSFAWPSRFEGLVRCCDSGQSQHLTLSPLGVSIFINASESIKLPSFHSACLFAVARWCVYLQADWRSSPAIPHSAKHGQTCALSSSTRSLGSHHLVSFAQPSRLCASQPLSERKSGTSTIHYPKSQHSTAATALTDLYPNLITIMPNTVSRPSVSSECSTKIRSM